MARADTVQRTYYALTLSATLANSMIWGVNTLFLLDAGLSNAQAFTANAFFTLGMVIFEIPTGVVADVRGRKLSYLLGATTLVITTFLYLMMWQIGAPFWAWCVVSALIGLGFTFFSGATEAWLVDALDFCGYTGTLERVFARGQIFTGVGMLTGAVGGGVIAQFTNLGVPYVVRILLLLVTIGIAAVMMQDWGFTPRRGANAFEDVRNVLEDSIDSGLRNPPVRWLMLAAPFTAGVGIYAFYAMQPYLLELYGDETAYAVAGIAAALFAGAQILGGLLVPVVQRIFRYRTQALIVSTVVSSIVLVLIGLSSEFWVVVGLLVVWSLTGAAAMPMRQAFVNGVVPGEQRATVLSFDSLMGSVGGVVTQPALGRVADVWSYSASYVVAGGIQALALPFVILARREHAPSDPIELQPAEES
ncbi:MAG: MFS transporter [Acidimicrobiia bacterium]|nr:MFS transporter [Acidimicrobiia bacterium]